MPRIFKAMLGLLAIAAAGLNPGAIGGALARRNHTPEPLPTYPLWPVNDTYLNSLIIPLAATPQQISSVPKHPKKKYTKAELARAKKLEETIEALDQRRLAYIRREHAQHEYYLGTYTFVQLKQMIDEVDERSLGEADAEFAQLMYCLHCEAYLELMKPEMKLEMGIGGYLPELQRTWMMQFERLKMQDKILTQQKKQTHSRLDPSHPIHRRTINRIKARFNTTLSTQDRRTRFLGMRQDRYDKATIADKNVIKAPGYYFDPNVLINVVREIKNLPFQYEFQQLYIAINRMSDPELQGYFTDEAMVAAQFTVLSIKSETDFPSDQYYFDSIMAIDWTQERLNVAVQNTELNLIELLMMMTNAPAFVKQMYIHAITLRIMNVFAIEYPHATLQENNARLTQFIKAIPGVTEETYRGCVMAFITITQQTHSHSKAWRSYVGTIALGIIAVSPTLFFYWYWGRAAAAPAVQNQNVQDPRIIAADHPPAPPPVVKKDKSKPEKPKQEKSKSNDTSVASASSAPPRENVIVEDEATKKRRETKEAILEQNTKLAQEQKQKEQELVAKKEVFIKLITVVHPYKRPDGDAAKIYENKVKSYKDSPDMEWFSKADLSKFNEFKSQLKAAFKESKNLGCDPDDNKILDALNAAYQASVQSASSTVHDNAPSSAQPAASLSAPSDEPDRGVFAEIISDDYLGPNYHVDDADEEQEHAQQSQDSRSCASSSTTTSPVLSNYKDQVKRKEIINVTPYLNAIHHDTPHVVLRHAYKLLVIKFHEAWKHKLGSTPVGRYFARLRNQLAHNAIAITDDLHIKLYAVLIKIESLQSDTASMQDWADAPRILQHTLPIRADRLAPLPQNEFIRLQQELIIIYQAAAACKDGYDNYRLAFISIFADLGEVCSKQEMHNAASPLDQAVMNALKAMSDFRHKEYHSADLRALPDDLQEQYMVLLKHFVPEGVSIQLGARSGIGFK